MLAHSHQEQIETIMGMSDEDLGRPHNSYDTISKTTHPVHRTVAGDAYEHYEEHLPWMKAILSGG